jgi:hypothetical protein
MSFFSSIPIWGWFDISFNVAVLIALCGEADWALKRLIPQEPNVVPSAEWRRKKLKKKFEWLLIFGIAGEVACLPFSLAESAESNRLAAQANERAFKFEREAGELFKVGEQAKESTTNAEVELEKAKTELEKAEAGRLELEKQVLALVEKTKTRSISHNGKSSLMASLGEMPKGHIEIIVFDKDPESIAFGMSIKRALTDAGCNVSFSPRGIFRVAEMFPQVIDLRPDLLFCVKDTSAVPAYALKIFNCLRGDGINVEGGVYNSDISADSLQLWVCTKLPAPEE